MPVRSGVGNSRENAFYNGSVAAGSAERPSRCGDSAGGQWVGRFATSGRTGHSSGVGRSEERGQKLRTWRREPFNVGPWGGPIRRPPTIQTTVLENRPRLIPPLPGPVLGFSSAEGLTFRKWRKNGTLERDFPARGNGLYHRVRQGGTARRPHQLKLRGGCQPEGRRVRCITGSLEGRRLANGTWEGQAGGDLRMVCSDFLQAMAR